MGTVLEIFNLLSEIFFRQQMYPFVIAVRKQFVQPANPATGSIRVAFPCPKSAFNRSISSKNICHPPCASIQRSHQSEASLQLCFSKQRHQSVDTFKKDLVIHLLHPSNEAIGPKQVDSFCFSKQRQTSHVSPPA